MESKIEIKQTKEQLKKLITDNTTFDIDLQDLGGGNVQVAVFLNTFSQDWTLCYQNGDMNGDHRGEAIFDNDGADDGLEELREILQNRAEFQHLIDETTFHSHLELDELIYEFCEEFGEKHNLDSYFSEL